MLKTLRVTFAVLSIFMVTLLFVDFTGTAIKLWPWLVKIQFMPAVLSANLMALAIIFVATLLFGRIYCSVVCPMGIFMDIVNWLRGQVGSKKTRKNRFAWTTASARLRLAIFTIFVILVILGLTSALASFLACLIEPYSAYGRIASQLMAPAWDWCNNLLASWSESRVDDYTFYRVASAVSIPVLIVAIITLIVVVLFAWFGGRDYCNKICPVGTILGYLSKYSLFKIHIDTDKCINCGKCARNCKAKCINAKEHMVDYTRCVACMDCIGHCSVGAISYSVKRVAANQELQADTSAGIDTSRRGFMVATGFLAGSLAMRTLAKTGADGGFTALKDKKQARRQQRIIPAGSVKLSAFDFKCTACQLCVQNCPHDVLKPTMNLEGFMQPSLDFTDGFCSPDCNICSTICPVGAIEPIDLAEKSSIKIGTAKVDLSSCISASEGKHCGACSHYCPAGAIAMTELADGSGKLMPVVNENACIGCGACEYHCPAGTIDSMASETSAIHVEGLDVHRII